LLSIILDLHLLLIFVTMTPYQFKSNSDPDYPISLLLEVLLRSMKILSLFGIFILSSFSHVALGQEWILMEPVVVTATLLEEPISRVPSSVTAITDEEMERQMAVTVEEAIRNAPGVYVRSASRG
jgi:outer membrane receptor protein involved in Fe transport